MLNLQLTEDIELIDSIFNSLKKEKPDNVSFAVLFANKTPVGITAFYIADTIHIKGIGVLPEERGKGYGDFISRVIVNMLSGYGNDIIVDYKSNYFYKFGFTDIEGDKMLVRVKDLKFPSKCKGDNV